MCKAEVYMYTSENPARCELEEGHRPPHRVVVDDGVFLWPMPESPTALDVICGEFASLLESQRPSVDEVYEGQIERVAKAFEEIGRPAAAEAVRKHWRLLMSRP